MLNVNGCWEAWCPRDTDDPRWKFLISSSPFQKKPNANTTTTTTSLLIQKPTGVCRNAFWLLAQQQQQDKGSINALQLSLRNRPGTFFSPSKRSNSNFLKLLRCYGTLGGVARKRSCPALEVRKGTWSSCRRCLALF